MCFLLRLIFHYWQLIEINSLINFSINFFIVAINLFRSNYWLLFEAMMVVHPMGVGVSISSPLELGLDSQVSALKSCALLPIGTRKSSSEATRVTRSHAII